MTKIDDPVAYDRGKQRAIRENARKSNRAKWLAAHADGQRLYNWLNGCCEFADRMVTKDPAYQSAYEQAVADLWADANEHGYDPYHDLQEIEERYEVSTEFNPLCRGMFSGNFGGFLLKMREDLDEWGRLSDKQTDVVRKALARAEQWEVERQKKLELRRAEDAASEHVGTVGERQTFHLNCFKRIELDGRYGVSYLHLCKDQNGNVVVYRGTQMWREGAVRVSATVKSHEVRDGVRQTLIGRPKKV